MPNNKRATNAGFAVSNVDTVAMVNSVTETTMFSAVVKAGSLGTNKELNFRVICNLTTAVLTNPTLTLRIKFGSATLVLGTGIGLALGVTNTPFVIEGTLAAKNSQSAQFLYAKIIQSASGVPLLNLTGAGMGAVDWTVDTTVDQTLSITAQYNLALPTTTLTYRYGSCEAT